MAIDRSKIISKVKTDSTHEYEIVPTKIANSTGTFSASLPTLTKDETIVVDADYVHTDNNYTTTEKDKLAGIASGAEVNVQSDWNATSGDAFIKNKPYIGAQIIELEENGSTTAGTWLAKTDAITALEDGQVFLYKIVVAGASTTTLNITANGTALGAKTIYRVGTTKLTTQYPVGHYLLLVYNSLNTCFRVMNDSDANSYAYLRQYQSGANAAGSGTKYPILTRYNLTNKSGTYDTAYSRYHTDVTIDTSNGNLDAASLSEDGVSLSDKYANLAEITYASLKALRDGGNLVPGRRYRITDYVTTTSQSNTSSAGHQFDIIVKANGANKLDENAYATQHAGDIYFANSDLSAWRLSYCLDNDTDRFVWAGSSNGKGVVYRMIDEFNNDCPYDFKNILFTVSEKYTDAYTFSYTENDAIKDASLLGISKQCYNNAIRAYINVSTSKQPLNSNVFYSTDASFECYSNTLGYNCYLDTFGNGCANNAFGDGCYSNTFGNDCSSNTFGDGCYSNTFGNSFIHNAFKDNCYSNTFRSNCSDNIFGYSYHHNVSGDYFWYNVFDNNCAYNYFGRFCISNIFGNECRYVTFGNSSSALGYYRDIIIDSGCQYLYVNSIDTSESTSNYLQNIHIHFGVTGESSSSRETITVSDRNLPYETNVYMNADGNVYTIINEGEGGGSYETATEEEIRALFSTQVADSQGNVITDANDQIIAVS